MPDSQPTTRLPLTLLAFWTGTLGAAYVGLLAFMVFAVPAYERQFVEERRHLLYFAELVIAFSRACVRYGYFVAMLIATAYLVVGALLGAVRPRENWRRPLWTVWLILTGMAVLSLFVAWLSLHIISIA